MFRLEKETDNDQWEVENLYDLTFAPGREALSSYRLRQDIEPVHDLCTVARNEENGLVGAIRYWPVVIGQARAECLLLGPISVHPTTQGEGLGNQLMRYTLNLARSLGWARVLLIGDLPYYSRFGFERAHNLEFPPPTNPDRLLIKALQPDAFQNVTGLVQSEKSQG